MARACSLSLISFPWASARYKIVWNISQDTKEKVQLKQFINPNKLMMFLFYKLNNMNYFEIISNKELSFFIWITCDFDRACLPGDMARACSLSLISFPWASARYKIVWNISQDIKEKARYRTQKRQFLYNYNKSWRLWLSLRCWYFRLVFINYRWKRNKSSLSFILVITCMSVL